MSDVVKIAMPWVTQCSYCNGSTLYGGLSVYLDGAPLLDVTPAVMPIVGAIDVAEFIGTSVGRVVSIEHDGVMS